MMTRKNLLIIMFHLSADQTRKDVWFSVLALGGASRILSKIRENIRFSGSDVLKEMIA
jgi:hypothetical protein